MDKAIKNKYFCQRGRIVGLLVLGYLLLPAQVFAGGLYVHKDKLYFDREYNKDNFQPDVPIQMDFQYDVFAWAGKPNAYAIFEIYRILPGSQEQLVGYVPAVIKRGEHRSIARFDLPFENSAFRIKYHVVPYFSNQRLKSGKYGGYLDAGEIKLIKLFYQSGNVPYVEDLITVKTGPKESLYIPKDNISIFFVNPTRVKTDLDAGRPITFTWRKGSDSSARAKDVRYSYRLDPIEDWSIFSTSKTVTYNFLRTGNYSFQVKAEFYIDGKRNVSSFAAWDFTVEKQIFGLSKKEILDKEAVKLPKRFFDTKHYANSRALLIGVEKYQDSKHFVNLPYIEKDIHKITPALTSRGFSVTTMREPPTKVNIEKTLKEFYEQSTTDDRIIVYFSGHGTSIGDDAYFVSSDCLSSDKKKTCVSFEYLKSWIHKMMQEKRVKHLLIIVDSCQSGLGVLSKSEKLPPIVELAKYPSSHMLTAGLVEQDVYIDNKTGMSVFTKYLVDGLSGSADMTGDDVISLTELLVYVQNNVAEYVSKEYRKRQTPVLGKINGAGEMIFLLK